MNRLSDENIKRLGLIVAMRGEKGFIDEFGNLCELKDEEKPEPETTKFLGMTIVKQKPAQKKVVIKKPLAEIVGDLMGQTYDPNIVVTNAIKIGLQGGKI